MSVVGQEQTLAMAGLMSAVGVKADIEVTLLDSVTQGLAYNGPLSAKVGITSLMKRASERFCATMSRPKLAQ